MALPSSPQCSSVHSPRNPRSCGTQGIGLTSKDSPRQYVTDGSHAPSGGL